MDPQGHFDILVKKNECKVLDLVKDKEDAFKVTVDLFCIEDLTIESFDEILDVRSTVEFSHDRIFGSVNIPCTSSEEKSSTTDEDNTVTSIGKIKASLSEQAL